MYSNKIIEMFQNIKNSGMIKGASGAGVAGNPCCGDIIKIFIKVEDEQIVDAKFKTFGCAAAIATSSTATDMIIGMTVEEAIKRLKGIHCGPRPTSCPDQTARALEQYLENK